MTLPNTHPITAEDLAAAHAKYAPPWMYPLLALWLLLMIAMVLWSMFPGYDLYNRMGYWLMMVTGFAGAAENAVKEQRGDRHAGGDGVGMRVQFREETVKRGSQTSKMSKTSSKASSSSVESQEWGHLGVAILMVTVTAPEEDVAAQRGERGKRRNTLDRGWRKLELLLIGVSLVLLKLRLLAPG